MKNKPRAGTPASEETRALLIAALGCNTAWGIIDGAPHLMGRLSERGRINCLVKAIQAAPGGEGARSLVARELDARLPPVIAPLMRAGLDAHVLLERVRELKPERNRVTGDDLLGALAVFWLVFLTALPAVVPFFLMPDPQLAMRTSNAVLIAVLFGVGWAWAGYTGAGAGAQRSSWRCSASRWCSSRSRSRQTGFR